MTGTALPNEAPPTQSNGWKTFSIIMISVLVTALVAVLVVKFYLFPGQFEPTQLSQIEQTVLDKKIARLDGSSEPKPGVSSKKNSKTGDIEPEAYREDDSKRSIELTERELNGLLGRNPGLAQKLAIDLSENLASAKLLIPLEPDFPILGGQTLRVNAGLELAFRDQKPVVILKGVSLWGVPIPNAWLGGLKNIDLIQEFGEADGFWKAFSDGLDHISVHDNHLSIKLKE